MKELYVLQRPATSSAVPLHLEAPRFGNTLQPGDLFEAPPPGLAPYCQRLSAADVEAAAGDKSKLAELIRTCAGQLRRVAFVRTLAAARLLQEIGAAAADSALPPKAAPAPKATPAPEPAGDEGDETDDSAGRGRRRK